MKLDHMAFNYDINPDILYWLVEIDNDRYGGCYSGAAYTAWPGPKADDIDAGDGTCDDFWRNHPDVLCGKGNTAAEAYNDLLKKIEWDTGAIKVVMIDGTAYTPETLPWRAA